MISVLEMASIVATMVISITISYVIISIIESKFNSWR